MKDENKILNEYDLEVYDKDILESFMRDLRSVYMYSCELEYLPHIELTEYIDEKTDQIEKIQRQYMRKYPFININKLTKVVQRLQLSILDFDFILNCLLCNSMPLFDRDLHDKLKDIKTWQYLVKINYNRLNKARSHKESLIKLSDVIFNRFIENIFDSANGNSVMAKSRMSERIYKYLDLFDYMSNYSEFTDLLERIKDTVDFDEIRNYVAGYINMIYKNRKYDDDEYPNFTPMILINCIMVMITNFYEEIEASSPFENSSPINIINQLVSSLEAGELYTDVGMSWLTNYELELCQTLFLDRILADVFDYAFDRLEQGLENPVTQLGFKGFSLYQDKVGSRLFAASKKLVGYTLWNAFNKYVL